MRKVLKKNVLLWIIICVIALTFTFLQNFSNKSNVQVNYNVDVVSTQALDYSALFETFDSVETSYDEVSKQKIIKTGFKMAGTSLDDIQYTNVEEDQNVTIYGTTSSSEETGLGQTDLTFDFGDRQELLQAFSNITFVDNVPQGTVIIDGVEYDVQEIMSQCVGENGVQECFWWLVAKVVQVVVKVVIVAVNVAAAAHFVYNIYKFATSEVVTWEGIAMLVAEGVIMVAGGAILGVAAKVGTAVTKGVVKASENAVKKYMTNKKGNQVLDDMVFGVKNGAKPTKTYSSDAQLRQAYTNNKVFKKLEGVNLTDHTKDDYIEIHHFVEQRQAGTKFHNELIHSDINSVGITKAMHRQISGIYSSKTKHLGDIEQIFGKGYFDGKTTFRDFVGKKTFEEQYEIGVKIFQYVKGNNKCPALFL